MNRDTLLEDLLKNKKGTYKDESLESFQDGDAGDSVDDLKALAKAYGID